MLIGGGLPFPGFQVRNMAQAWLVLETENSSLLKAGLVNAVPGIAVILFSFVAGAVTDRSERRSILIWTKLVIALAGFLTAYLVASGRFEWWHLIPIGTVIGVMFAFVNPATQTFTMDLVGRESLISSAAIGTTIANLGAIVGPAAAGYLLARGPELAFYLLGAIYAVAFVASAFVKTRSQGSQAAKTPFLADLRQGLKYAASTPLIKWLLVLACASLFAGMFQAAIPLFARDILEVGEVGYGALVAVQGVGSLAGSLTLLIRGNPANKGRLIVLDSLAAMVAMVAMLIFAVSPWYALSIFALIAFGAAMGVWFVLMPTVLQTNTAPEMRGRVMSLFFIAVLGLQVGWVVGGLLDEVIGIALTTVIAALGAGGIAVLAYVRSPDLRRLA
jgi:MFS family permease